jgi:hypothetical protein
VGTNFFDPLRFRPANEKASRHNCAGENREDRSTGAEMAKGARHAVTLATGIYGINPIVVGWPTRLRCLKKVGHTGRTTAPGAMPTTAAETSQSDTISTLKLPICGARQLSSSAMEDCIYVIQNGMRLTGMPAWCAAGAFRLNHPTPLILVAAKRRLVYSYKARRNSGHTIDNPKKGKTDDESRAYTAWRQFGRFGDFVVKVSILLVTPSLLPLESFDSTV